VFDVYPLIRPLFMALPAEAAHRASIAALKSGLVPGFPGPDDPILATRAFGLDFPNPIGLAAGYDKGGEAIDALLALGFGFVEAGTVTPRPQPGNPRPRIFRLIEDEAVINRLGFNSEGMMAVRARLAGRAQRGGKMRGILGINIGANKTSTDQAADYIAAFRELSPFADYVTVNVSSPNTPGLRDLQSRDNLRALLGKLMEAKGSAVKPILLKIAPDLDDVQLADIVEVAVASGISGLIVSNTTIARPLDLASPNRSESGGLSGAPLFVPSTLMLRKAAVLVKGRIPLIGVGGIRSGADAYAKIRAGASLVQLYSALVYRGPALVGRIKAELGRLLRRDGFDNVAKAVGADLV
jgi:dihydroorotate dehydrogenase